MNTSLTAGPGSLQGQVAIVTGASSGIGRATALALAELGSDIVVHYRRRGVLAMEVVDACQQRGVRALAVQADLSHEHAADGLLIKAASLGDIAILVNNAGSSLTKLLIDTSLTEWQAVLADNLTSAYLCTRAVLPGMVQRGYGRVINVSSVWGITGGACEAAYSAAKGGLISMTKAVAKEMAQTGVTVNVVAPGAIETDMLGDLLSDDRAVLYSEIPMGRTGSPSEVANVISFLASPAASYMTGQVLSPNGGWVT